MSFLVPNLKKDMKKRFSESVGLDALSRLYSLQDRIECALISMSILGSLFGYDVVETITELEVVMGDLIVQILVSALGSDIR